MVPMQPDLSEVPSFSLLTPSLVPFSGPLLCYTSPVYLSHFPVTLTCTLSPHLIPLSGTSCCPCSNNFPTFSPPTVTPSPFDGLYGYIHLLPVWSLVSVYLHQQYNIIVAHFRAPTYTCPYGCSMALWLTQPLTEISTRGISCGKRQLVCRADILATLGAVCLEILGASNSWSPNGLSMSVMG
jgi:hypothetical protein